MMGILETIVVGYHIYGTALSKRVPHKDLGT